MLHAKELKHLYQLHAKFIMKYIIKKRERERERTYDCAKKKRTLEPI